MGQDPVLAIEDEGHLRGVAGHPRQELRQVLHRDHGEQHADQLAVAPHRLAQVEHGGVRPVLQIQDLAPIGVDLAGRLGQRLAALLDVVVLVERLVVAVLLVGDAADAEILGQIGDRAHLRRGGQSAGQHGRELVHVAGVEPPLLQQQGEAAELVRHRLEMLAQLRLDRGHADLGLVGQEVEGGARRRGPVDREHRRDRDRHQAADGDRERPGQGDGAPARPAGTGGRRRGLGGERQGHGAMAGSSMRPSGRPPKMWMWRCGTSWCPSSPIFDRMR